MLQGGVDLSYLQWGRTTASAARSATGSTSPSAASAPRGAVGCSDRGHTAVSQLQPGGRRLGAAVRPSEGARWLHTGGIFCALSEGTPAVARAAMRGRRARHARLVRPQLSRLALARDRRPGAGPRGQPRADAVRRRAVRQRGRLLGGARLRARGRRRGLRRAAHRRLPRHDRRGGRRVSQHHPVATTLRTARSANVNGWGAICYHEGSSTRSRSATSRSSTGSAVATRSRRASSTDCWPARIRSGRSSAASPTARWRCRRPATRPWRRFAEVMRVMKGAGARIERWSDGRAEICQPYRGRSGSCRSCAPRRPSCAAGRRGGHGGRDLDLRDHDDGARRRRGHPSAGRALRRKRAGGRGNGAGRGRRERLHRRGRARSSSAPASTRPRWRRRAPATWPSCPALSPRPR